MTSEIRPISFSTNDRFLANRIERITRKEIVIQNSRDTTEVFILQLYKYTQIEYSAYNAKLEVCILSSIFILKDIYFEHPCRREF